MTVATKPTDKRPCPYCYQPDEEPTMENIDRLVPPGGFAPVHEECQRSVDLYLRDVAVARAMATQQGLFDSEAEVRAATKARREASIQERFLTFHGDNPRIYGLLCQFARQLKDRGYSHGGIGHVWERVRWELYITTQDADGFKLNNDYRSRYARLIMRSEPDLQDFFRTRELRAA